MLNKYNRVVTTYKTSAERGLSLRVRRSWFADEEQDAGASTSEIDWSKVPEDVIKNHPLYKSVLTESIQRRQELAELKKQLAPPTDQPKTEDKPDKLSIFEQELAELRKVVAEQAEREKLHSRSALVNAAAAAHKIPADLHKYITGDTAEAIAASAAELAKHVKPEQVAPPPANPAQDAKDQSLLKAVTERMANVGGQSPFDPGFQRQLGG